MKKMKIFFDIALLINNVLFAVVFIVTNLKNTFVIINACLMVIIWILYWCFNKNSCIIINIILMFAIYIFALESPAFDFLIIAFTFVVICICYFIVAKITKYVFLNKSVEQAKKESLLSIILMAIALFYALVTMISKLNDGYILIIISIFINIMIYQQKNFVFKI